MKGGEITMIQKKHLLSTALVLTIGSVLFTSSVSAHGRGFGMNQESIIERFAQAFGKTNEEVSAVFDTLHQEHMTEMQEQLAERLTSLVEAGTITEEQKTLLIEKHAQMQEQREAEKETLGSMTWEERRREGDEHRDEMEAWAEENGIDLSLIHMQGGRREQNMNKKDNFSAQEENTSGDQEGQGLFDRITNVFK